MRLHFFLLAFQALAIQLAFSEDFELGEFGENELREKRQFGGGGGPCGCPKIYKPVCGIDRNTYGNPCMANCAGVPILIPRECGHIRMGGGFRSGGGRRRWQTGIVDPGWSGRRGFRRGGFRSGGGGGGGVGGSDFYPGSPLCPACRRRFWSAPVCGLNGQKYSHYCKAECEGVKWIPIMGGINGRCPANFGNGVTEW